MKFFVSFLIELLSYFAEEKEPEEEEEEEMMAIDEVGGDDDTKVVTTAVVMATFVADIESSVNSTGPVHTNVCTIAVMVCSH